MRSETTRRQVGNRVLANTYEAYNTITRVYNKTEAALNATPGVQR